MTDSSLDDFFAKKDKSKKSKSKGSKYTTSEEITKKFEKSQRKCSSNEPTSTGNNTQSSTTVTTGAREDDEWNEVELEKEKDYSGLRIQALSIADREKEEELAKEQQPQENGEDSKVSEANAGPWRTMQAAGASVAASEMEESEQEEQEEPPQVEAEPEPVKVATYRPPAMRYSSQSSGGAGSGATRRPGRNVPEIDSELHFPSLSQAVDVPKGTRTSEKSFQSVKHGSRSKDDSLHQGVQLDLGNKFSALGSN